MLKKLFPYSLLAMLCIALLLPSCTVAQDVNRHILIAVDYSASALNVDRYWEAIAVVTGCSKSLPATDRHNCEMIQGNDQITLFKISGQTMRNVEVLADIYLPEKPALESRLKYQKKMSIIKAQFHESIDRALSNPAPAQNTEIMAAAREAARRFKAVAAPAKYFVILSDMVEESEFCNFARQRRIDAIPIIQKEADAGRLPDLAGVKVYVSGATAQTDRRYDEIRNFWQLYFHNTGAILDEVNYANLLSRFP